MIPLAFRGRGVQALAIDIGGTKILAGLVAGDGAVTGLVEVPTPAREGADAIVEAVIAAAGQVRAAAPAPPVRCGVGTAGVVAPDGSIASATDLLRGWAGTPLGARLAAALGLEVRVLNDVHATGLCEALLGAARGRASALVVAVGTGIGGAIVRHGSVEQGAHGIAGSIGHLPAPLRQGRICSCGACDHVEAYASGPSLEAEYRRRTGRALGLRAIAASADPEATAVIAEGAAALGAVIGGANNLVDTEVVVIGGGVAGLGEAYLAPLRRAAATEALGATRAVPVVPARFGAQACLVGAGLLALG